MWKSLYTVYRSLSLDTSACCVPVSVSPLYLLSPNSQANVEHKEPRLFSNIVPG